MLGWDKNGPLYEIQNGRAHYVGSFSEHDMACDPDAIRRSVIEKLLRHSAHLAGIRRTGSLSRSK